MHYVKGNTHIAFNSDFGTFFNKLTFSLAHFGMITTVNISRKWLSIKDKFNRRAIRNILKYGKSIYTISPAIFLPAFQLAQKPPSIRLSPKKQKIRVGA